jgi:hypothetical protein
MMTVVSLFVANPDCDLRRCPARHVLGSAAIAAHTGKDLSKPSIHADTGIGNLYANALSDHAPSVNASDKECQTASVGSMSFAGLEISTVGRKIYGAEEGTRTTACWNLLKSNHLEL